jgi:beta-galactosidase
LRWLFVRRFSVAQLAAANHEHELSPEPVLHVHCDAAHCGLGGDDSWTRSVHAAHHTHNHPHSVCFPNVLEKSSQMLQMDRAFSTHSTNVRI